MARIRTEQKTALMVVDVQIGVVKEAWEADRIIKNISSTVAKARQAGVPVIWVQHTGTEFKEGHPDWPWVPELVPAAGEVQIHKRFNSAFEETNLDEVLADLGISHIVLAGAATNWCIRATAYGALGRGYDLTLVEDGHTTDIVELDEENFIPAEQIIQELNLVLPWLRYPQVTIVVEPAEKLVFA